MEAAASFGPRVSGGLWPRGRDRPRQPFHLDVEWVEQAERLGTGHAVQQAMAQVADDATVLVLYGDVPLVNRSTLETAARRCRRRSHRLDDRRVARPDGVRPESSAAERGGAGIVEERDADPEQRRVNEVNTGILAAPAALLRVWLEALKPENAQGEYYLDGRIRNGRRRGCGHQHGSTRDGATRCWA